jgi:hypothetical protein
MIQVRAISDYHNGYIRVVDMWPRAQIQLASVRSALIDKPPPEDTGRYSNEGVAATEGLVKGASIRLNGNVYGFRCVVRAHPVACRTLPPGKHLPIRPLTGVKLGHLNSTAKAFILVGNWIKFSRRTA